MTNIDVGNEWTSKNMNRINVCNYLYMDLFKPAGNKLNKFKSNSKSHITVKTTVSKHPAQWQSQRTW